MTIEELDMDGEYSTGGLPLKWTKISSNEADFINSMHDNGFALVDSIEFVVQK